MSRRTKRNLTPDSVGAAQKTCATPCRHLSRPAGAGGSWPAGRDPASPAPLRRDSTAPLPGEPARTDGTHSPCSRLHARPAGRIAAPAGDALTSPFHPSPRRTGLGPCTVAGLLSVAVVVGGQLLARRPHLLFRGATLPGFRPAGSREVPLPVHDRQRRRFHFVFGC